MQLAVFSDDNSANDLQSLIKLLSIASNADINIIYHDNTIFKYDLLDATYKIKRIIHYLPKNSIVLIDVNSFYERPVRIIYKFINSLHYISFDSGILDLVAPKDESPTYLLRTEPITIKNYVFTLFRLLEEKPWTSKSSLAILDDYTRLNIPNYRVYQDDLFANIIHIDNYGNLSLDIEANFLKEFTQNSIFEVHLLGSSENIRITNSYDQSDDGSLFCVENHMGLIQIGVNRSNAARIFGLKLMDTILFTRKLK
jgi:hypothetical protein